MRLFAQGLEGVTKRKRCELRIFQTLFLNFSFSSKVMLSSLLCGYWALHHGISRRKEVVEAHAEMLIPVKQPAHSLYHVCSVEPSFHSIQTRVQRTYFWCWKSKSTFRKFWNSAAPRVFFTLLTNERALLKLPLCIVRDRDLKRRVSRWKENWFVKSFSHNHQSHGRILRLSQL